MESNVYIPPLLLLTFSLPIFALTGTDTIIDRLPYSLSLSLLFSPSTLRYRIYRVFKKILLIHTVSELVDWPDGVLDSKKEEKRRERRKGRKEIFISQFCLEEEKSVALRYSCSFSSSSSSIEKGNLIRQKVKISPTVLRVDVDGKKKWR